MAVQLRAIVVSDVIRNRPGYRYHFEETLQYIKMMSEEGYEERYLESIRLVLDYCECRKLFAPLYREWLRKRGYII